MKNGTNANKTSTIVDRRPHAVLGAGRVTAAIYKEGDERGGWQYRFNLFCMDYRSGIVTQCFTPEDIVDLTKSSRLLAFAIADDGCLAPELRDDLLCLSSCLGEVLDGSSVEPPNLHTDGVVNAVRRVVTHLWAAESEDFKKQPKADHLFPQLVLLDRWLKRLESTAAENAVLTSNQIR